MEKNLGNSEDTFDKNNEISFPSDEEILRRMDKTDKWHSFNMEDIDKKIRVTELTKHGEQLFLYRKKINTKNVLGYYSIYSQYYIVNQVGEIVGRVPISIGNPHSLSMDFWLKEDYQGKGIGTVALEEVIKQVYDKKEFDNLKFQSVKYPDIKQVEIKSIGLEISDDNDASKRIATKNGFEHVDERAYVLTREAHIARKEKSTKHIEDANNVVAENCPADAIREYIEKIISKQRKYIEEGKEVPKDLLIPQEIVLSPMNMEFLLNSKLVDYVGAGETGNEVQFYWEKTEKLPALELRAEKREDGKFILSYIKEEASEEKEEFIWDKNTKEGKKGTIVVSKTKDALEEIYDMDR